MNRCNPHRVCHIEPNLSRVLNNLKKYKSPEAKMLAATAIDFLEGGDKPRQLSFAEHLIWVLSAKYYGGSSALQTSQSGGKIRL